MTELSLSTFKLYSNSISCIKRESIYSKEQIITYV